MTTTEHPSSTTSVNARWSLRSLSVQELQVELSHVRHRLSRDATPNGQRMAPSRHMAPSTTALRHREKVIVEELAYRADAAT